MKKLIIIVLVIISHTCFAQLDSLKINIPTDSLSSLTQKLDSVQTSVRDRVDSAKQFYNKASGKIQSLSLHFQQKNDSLGKLNLDNKIDSIKGSVRNQVDSISQYYNQATTKIQNLSSRYQKQIDSLSNLKLPTEKYTKKLDSLSNKLSETKQKAESKIEAIKQKATEKLKSLPIPPELQGKASQIASSLEIFKLPTLDSGVKNPIDLNGINPSLDNLIPSVDLKGIPDMPSVNGIPDVTKDLNVGLELPKVEEMSDVTKNLDDVSGVTSGVTEQVGTLQQNAGEITGDVNQVKQIDKLAENQAMKLEGVKELTNTKDILPLNPMTSEEEAKKQLLNKAKEAAVDHFKGKEDALKSAMDKISKYKQKYSSVSSLSEVTKRPKNPMKGKPLRERIVPGLQFQIFQKQENFLTDFNLYAGYRVNSRLTTGLGWNQRVAYNLDRNEFNPKARVFGPRAFGEFKLSRGFSPRAEVEVMNTLIPSFVSNSRADDQNREWVVSGLVGIKKEYRFYKNIKGTTAIMFNVFHPRNKSPYPDWVNARFGFEFPMKKKAKHKV